jgi:hypothetical protein
MRFPTIPARVLGFALALSGLAATSCTSLQTSLCDAICECENCGEKGQERCDIGIQSELDKADIYGCLGQAEEYYDCIVENASCSGDEFAADTANCADEAEQLFDCKKDSSRRDPGPY